MSDYYRIIKTQEASNYTYCTVNIPFDSHMKTAYSHILIFTLLAMPVALLRRFLLRKLKCGVKTRLARSTNWKA